jgi:BirA family transcriptional regulator, biotin operon repressor / biotin---[acetyl-CoA-carboxylase] ligase
LDAARNGAPEGLVLVTDHQTAGRGRQGRTWVDEPASSLLMSVLLRPDPSWAPLIPLAVGLAMVESLAPLTSATIGLKWPNDVLVMGQGEQPSERKMAGILAEATTVGAELVVVVGCGLNLSWPKGPPPDVSDRAVDLASIADVDVDRLEIMGAFLTCFDAKLRDFEAGRRDQVLDQYRHQCISLGRDLRLATPSGEVVGRAIAIDPGGGLTLLTDAGEVTVTAGDAHHI